VLRGLGDLQLPEQMSYKTDRRSQQSANHSLVFSDNHLGELVYVRLALFFGSGHKDDFKANLGYEYHNVEIVLLHFRIE